MNKPGISFRDIVRIKWKYRNILIAVFLIAAISSAALSLLLPNEYRATATIFPARTSEFVINDYGIRRGNLSQFGEIEEAEEFLELLNSPQFKLRIIEKLKLSDHYEINKDQPEARTRTLSTYNSQVSTSRTKYNAVEISVLDKEPEMARNIATTIADEIDQYRADMIKSRTRETFTFFKNKKQELNKLGVDLASQLHALNLKGVVSIEERAGLYESLSGGPSIRIRTQIDSNLKYASQYDVIQFDLEEVLERQNTLAMAEDQFKTQTEGALSFKFDVLRPLIPERKAKPKRSILTLLGAIGATIFALTILIVKEKWTDLKAFLE